MEFYNIASYHNGLGDCLQFSTLPEMLTEQKDAQVFLYEGPDVKDFPNIEIKELVWGTNPFVLTDGQEWDWECGDTPKIQYKNTCNDFIKNWEIAHGLTPKNSLPKIYYPPRQRKGIGMLIELSGKTLSYDREAVKQTVLNAVGNSGISKACQLVSPYQSNPILIPGIPIIKCLSIWDLWDYVCSCTGLITLNSGTHSLAAAASNGWNEFYHASLIPEKDKDWIIEQRKFIYPGVEYFTESGIKLLI
jgi:hypothetical protein